MSPASAQALDDGDQLLGLTWRAPQQPPQGYCRLRASGFPAALPDFKPVPGVPGFFTEGGLTAKRSGNAWLVVGQGTGLAERMRLLLHLSTGVGA